MAVGPIELGGKPDRPVGEVDLLEFRAGELLGLDAGRPVHHRAGRRRHFLDYLDRPLGVADGFEVRLGHPFVARFGRHPAHPLGVGQAHACKIGMLFDNPRDALSDVALDQLRGVALGVVIRIGVELPNPVRPGEFLADENIPGTR